MSIPTLREARTASFELKRDSAVTDIILQGIARDGSGIFQAICLRRSQAHPQLRTFTEFRQPSDNFADGELKAVMTEGSYPGGPIKPYYSMISRKVRSNLSTRGMVHTFSTGTKLRLITTELAKGIPVDSMGHLTKPEELRFADDAESDTQSSITQLTGISYMLRHAHPNQPAKANWRSVFFADRQLVRPAGLSPGQLDRRPPMNQMYQQRFRDAGKPGVARALFNTARDANADYESQPVTVSLGVNHKAVTMEQVADHLHTLFNPDAIAVRWINREDSTDVQQFVWNATAKAL